MTSQVPRVTPVRLTAVSNDPPWRVSCIRRSGSTFMCRFARASAQYCDFASFAGRQADIPRYVEVVVREITRRGAEMGHPQADTIFLGGGTPSLLDESQAIRILNALFESFPVAVDAEITCECNPGTLAPPFARRSARQASTAFPQGAGRPAAALATSRQDPRLAASDRFRQNRPRCGH